MNEFVDTNVLLYAHDSTALLKRDRSIELLSRLATGRTGAISIQVLVEFYNNARRKFRVTSQYAEAVLEGFSDWPIHRPDYSSVIGAIRLQQRYQVAWFDAMILNSAMEMSCSILWTEDFQDGQRFGDLVVRNPYKNDRVV